jgi:photosystem II stability/assembly factor-like uncharacterized protein
MLNLVSICAHLLIQPAQTPKPTLHSQSSGTTQRLQAVSVVNDTVVWVSGTGGTWGLTSDGGATWRTAVVPGADSLEFRDVHGVDARRAYLLAAGPGDRSRIYATTDGGATWLRQFQNAVPEAFYDCFAFWTPDAGLAMSDGVNGHFPVIRTADGGRRWEPVEPGPVATTGEGAFAASGTCVATWGDSTAWIATGAGERGHVLRTHDRGATWWRATTPIVHGSPTRGHTSIAFRSARVGLAVGGDILDTATVGANYVIRTLDGGASWTVGGTLAFAGAAYGAAFVPSTDTAVAVGPRGASWTPDGGRTWQPLDTVSHWSVAFAPSGTGWMVGPRGRITRVRFR